MLSSEDEIPSRAGSVPQPITCRLVTRFSNRNCKELKTDVTRCKQRSVTSSNRNRQPGKAKGEKAKCPKFCDLAGFAFAPLTTCHWALSNRQIRQLEMGISRALSTKDAILIDRKGGDLLNAAWWRRAGINLFF